jgi:hypothetical protein
MENAVNKENSNHYSLRNKTIAAGGGNGLQKQPPIDPKMLAHALGRRYDFRQPLQAKNNNNNNNNNANNNNPIAIITTTLTQQ